MRGEGTTFCNIASFRLRVQKAVEAVLERAEPYSEKARLGRNS